MKGKAAEEKRTMSRFTFRTHHQILLGLTNQGGWDVRGEHCAC
jgi:hypothetical protein